MFLLSFRDPVLMLWFGNVPVLTLTSWFCRHRLRWKMSRCRRSLTLQTSLRIIINKYVKLTLHYHF